MTSCSQWRDLLKLFTYCYQHWNGDVEKQGSTKMYFARDPISAKNLVTTMQGWMPRILLSMLPILAECPGPGHRLVLVHAKMQYVNCVWVVPVMPLIDCCPRQMGKLGCNVHVIIIITIIIIFFLHILQSRLWAQWNYFGLEDVKMTKTHFFNGRFRIYSPETPFFSIGPSKQNYVVALICINTLDCENHKIQRHLRRKLSLNGWVSHLHK